MALNDYEDVDSRLHRWWEQNPGGRVVTELVSHNGDEWVFRAAVFVQATDEVPRATGYAQEITGGRGVNEKSACENCETSAVGRALANAGYSPKGRRPSREEMEKAERPAQAKVRQLRQKSETAVVPDHVQPLLERLNALPEESRKTVKAQIAGKYGKPHTWTAEHTAEIEELINGAPF